MKRRLPQQLVVLVALASSLGAASYDARFLAGLRSRQLFTLAEEHGQRRLADSTLSDALRIETTLELSRTWVDHALASLPEARDPLWKQAHVVLVEQGRALATHPRRVLFDVQAALVELAQGELARQEAEVTLDDPARLASAREHLRRGISGLERVAQQIVDLRRSTNAAGAKTSAPWTTAELASLEKNVAWQRGRAQRVLGQSYPAGSPDRLSALSQAAETLAPLAGLDASDAIAFAARLEELSVRRLLGEADALAARLTALLELEPSPQIVLQARAEAARLLLDEGRIDAAVELSTKLPAELAGVVDPTWDDVLLEIAVAAYRAAQAANKQDDMTRWRQASFEQLDRIDQRHGAYHARRGELLVARHVRLDSGGGQLGDARRAAEALFRAGQIDAAAAAYDQLAQQAVNDKQPPQAFEAWFTAGSILQSRQQFLAAAERYRAAARAAPQLDRAGDAHLAAIWNFAQAHPRPDDAQRRAYHALLDEHLELWHTQASADQVRLWRAQELRARREYAAALDVLRAIASDRPRFPEALAETIAIQELRLTAEQAAGRAVDEVATRAALELEQLVTRGQGRWPELWSPTDRNAALAAARLWMLYIPGRAERAEQLLTAALSSAAEASAEWREETQGWLLLALVQRGRFDEATTLADQLQNITPAARRRWLAHLQRAYEQIPVDRRVAWATLVQRVGASLPVDPQENATLRRDVDFAQIRALALTGERGEAIRRAEALSKSAAQDGDVQEVYAEVLSGDESPSGTAAALAQWRLIERRSPPGTPRWFRAKLQLAQLHVRQGNVERARQLIAITRELHPELGGPDMKRAFDALESRLGSTSRP